MQLFLICNFILTLKLINSELLVCDNNECRRTSHLTSSSLFTDLKTIIEGNQNTTKYLEKLNEKIDQKIAVLTTEIGNIKKIVYNQTNKLIKPSYSLYDNLWIVVQRRYDGSVDFYRNWSEYKQGFGNQLGEFFVGLEKIHNLTNYRDHELLVILGDYEGGTKYAHYDHFLIGNETDRYILKKLGKYRGTAGDHLRLHLNMLFSTKDRDNDEADEGNCAEWFKGAWWYYHCMSSNLNGPYREGGNLTESERGIGITWGSYEEIKFSYKSAQMMIRAKEKVKKD